MTYAYEMVGALPPGQAVAIGGSFSNGAAVGTTQATALTLKSSNNIITGATGTNGVVLFAGQGGDEVWIFNNSASSLLVYPPVGAAIAVNGTGVGVVNTAFTHLTFKSVMYKCLTPTQWIANVSA